MEKTLDSFLKFQRESEERFKRHEEERWKRETELEEKRRKEDREDEMRLMGMLASILRPRPSYQGPIQDFDDDNFSYYSQH